MSETDDDADDAPVASAATGSAPRKRQRRKKHGVWWNRMEYAALAGTAGILKYMPERFALAFGAACGSFYGGLCRWLRMRDHSVAVKNLELAFPEKTPAERDAILRAMWRNWGRFGGECTQLLKLNPDRLKEIVSIEPWDRFLQLRELVKKRGLLVLTAHYGSFELLHAAVSAYGVPITLVHRPMSNPLADEWVRRLRARFGTNMLARGNAARDVVRELRSGRIVAIPFDQTARKHTRVFAPFFGVAASTTSGLARLAMASGAPVYPVVLVRIGNTNKHKVWIGEEIVQTRTRDREADILNNTIRFNRALESIVREHPDHWIWMYRRFKQQPDGLCSPYLQGAPSIEKYRAAGAAIA